MNWLSKLVEEHLPVGRQWSRAKAGFTIQWPAKGELPSDGLQLTVFKALLD